MISARVLVLVGVLALGAGCSTAGADPSSSTTSSTRLHIVHDPYADYVVPPPESTTTTTVAKKNYDHLCVSSTTSNRTGTLADCFGSSNAARDRDWEQEELDRRVDRLERRQYEKEMEDFYFSR